MKKRWSILILTLTLVLGALPVTAFADPEAGEPAPPKEEAVQEESGTDGGGSSEPRRSFR